MKNDKIEKIAKRVIASKTVACQRMCIEGGHIVGELWCAPDDTEFVTQYEFLAVEKEFQRYFDVFRQARRSVLVNEKPVVYYSTLKTAFFCKFDFDVPKDASYSDEERVDEICKLIDGIQ